MSIDKNRYLTKTLLMKGFQCPKHLYLYLTSPELATECDNKRVQQEGTEIGVLAQNLYPNGYLISEKQPDDALCATQLHWNKEVLFEPAFVFENLFFRADILENTPNGLNLIEVKSSTEPKEYQLQDLSIQTFILLKLGYNLNRIYLCHINKEYTLEKELKDLFCLVDVTEDVLNRIPETEIKIRNLQRLSEDFNQEDIGPHCNKPFVCPFKKHCHSQKNINHESVVNFPNLNQKWDFYYSGKVKITDLSEEDLKTDSQKKFLRLFTSEEPQIDCNKIKEFFSSWKFPLYFLDFETFDNLLPKYPKTKPNAKISYQFSVFKLTDYLDIQNVDSYVADSINEDPRFPLAYRLVESLKDAETIVSYNASFEKGRIEEMAGLIPELREALLSIASKIVDLLDVIRTAVFFKEFKGSFSIKAVIPAIFGEESSYKHLAVQNGLEAQNSFLDAIKNGTLNKIKKDLIEYCDKDVVEMIRLYLFLRKQVEVDKNIVLE